MTAREKAELIGRAADLLARRPAVIIDAAAAREAIGELERTGDAGRIRALVEEAERQATLLHALGCRCRICRGRRG